MMVTWYCSRMSQWHTSSAITLGTPPFLGTFLRDATVVYGLDMSVHTFTRLTSYPQMLASLTKPLTTLGPNSRSTWNWRQVPSKSWDCLP